jgi:hypothetical protein
MSTTSQQWRVPLVLATLLFVLSSAAFWFEFRRKPESERAAENSKKVFDLSQPGSASRILLKQPDPSIQATIELSCLDATPDLCRAGSNARWEMTAPAQLKADDSNVQSLVSTLNHLVPKDTFGIQDEPPEQRPALLRQYGLDASQRMTASQISVTDMAGRKRTLYLGERHPMGETRFAAILENTSDPEQILLIPSEFGGELKKPLSHWREKRFVPRVASEINRISLLEGNRRIHAIRSSETGAGWIIRSGSGSQEVEVPGDIENVDSWVAGIAFLAAEGFLSEKKDSPEGRKILAGTQVVMKFELSSENQKPFHFEIREKRTLKESRWIAISDSLDPIFQLDPDARNRLSKKISDLQLSKLLGSLDRFKTRRISLESESFGKGPIVLQSDSSGSRWKREDTSSELKPSVASDLLEKLSGNRIVGFPKIGVSEPTSALRIELRDEKGELLRNLRIWKSGSKLFARDLRLQKPRVLELDPSLEKALPWDSKFFSALEKTQ